MTRSRVERDKRRVLREQARARASFARWALVAERLSNRGGYPYITRLQRLDAVDAAIEIRGALETIGVPSWLDEESRIERIEAAQLAVRALRETLRDSRIAPMTMGDEVADRARELAWHDSDRAHTPLRIGGADLTPSQWDHERRRIVVRTSWVAISSDDGESWVWDADSADTYRRVRELQGDEYADTSARRYLRLPVLGVAREVRDGE